MFHLLDPARSQTSWQAHRGAVNAMCMNSDDSILISGGADGVLAFWDISTQSALRTVQMKGGVLALLLEPMPVKTTAAGQVTSMKPLKRHKVCAGGQLERVV